MDLRLTRGISVLIIAATTLTAFPAWASLHPGDVAPNFTKIDITGMPRSLSDYLGKVVILNILGYS